MKLILVAVAIVLACVQAEEYDKYEKYASKYDKYDRKNEKYDSKNDQYDSKEEKYDSKEVKYDSKDEKYSSKYDNMNLDEVLGNKRLLNGYMKCALDKGPCTAEGKDLKYYISDGLKTGCSKCTPRQRKGIKKVMQHLIKYEPEYWQQAVEKYDPQRVYTKKYEKEVYSWE